MTDIAIDTVALARGPAASRAREEALRDLENDATDRARQLAEQIQFGTEQLARLRAARRQLIHQATTFHTARTNHNRRTS